MPVLEVDLRLVVVERGEAHFDLGQEIGVAVECVINAPGQHQAAGRLPFQYVAPRLFFTTLMDAVPTSSDSGLEDDPFQRRFADVVRARPPPIKAVSEHLKGVRLGGVDDEALADRRGFDRRAQGEVSPDATSGLALGARTSTAYAMATACPGFFGLVL